MLGVHASHLHILKLVFLLDLDNFGHELVLKVDGHDGLPGVALIVGVVAFLKEGLFPVNPAQFGKLFLREKRGQNLGYDLGLPFLIVALPEEHEIRFTRLYSLFELIEIFGLFWPDDFSLVYRNFHALIKCDFRHILEHDVTEETIYRFLANMPIAVTFVDFW